jgi:hypothetical protein
MYTFLVYKSLGERQIGGLISEGQDDTERCLTFVFDGPLH